MIRVEHLGREGDTGREGLILLTCGSQTDRVLICAQVADRPDALGTYLVLLALTTIQRDVQMCGIGHLDLEINPVVCLMFTLLRCENDKFHRWWYHGEGQADQVTCPCMALKVCA